MRVVSGDVRDDVDAVVLDDVAPVGRGALEPELARDGCYALAGAPGHRDEPDLLRQRANVGERVERVRVCPADPAVPDEADPDRVSRHGWERDHGSVAFATPSRRPR